MAKYIVFYQVDGEEKSTAVEGKSPLDVLGAFKTQWPNEEPPEPHRIVPEKFIDRGKAAREKAKKEKSNGK